MSSALEGGFFTTSATWDINLLKFSNKMHVVYRDSHRQAGFLLSLSCYSLWGCASDALKHRQTLMTVRGLEWLIAETHRIKIMSCFRFGLTQLPPLVAPFSWIERVSFNPGQRFGKMTAGYCGWVDLTLRCLATQHGWLGWRVWGGGAPPVLKSDTLDFGSPLLWYLLCDIRHVT